MNRIVFFLISMMLMIGSHSNTHAARGQDFVANYERGKIMLRQKLYFDAVRDFTKSVNTIRGRTHFGAHYYLATAYYWLPDIQQAIRMITIAKSLAKNNTQKAGVARLLRRINGLYGKLKFDPEVDPEEVGRLKVTLEPKSTFSNQHKQRYFRIIAKRLQGQGVLLGGRPLYLPKGDYKITIIMPQCLSYGFLSGGSLTNNVTVGEQEVALAVKAKRSCACEGGQKIYKNRDKLYCACPQGTGWNSGKSRCEVGVNPWPWIALGAGVIAVGVAVPIILLNLPDGTDRSLIKAPGKTSDPTNSATVWQ